MKKYISEFIGTFMLVFFGCGTAAAVGCASDKGSGCLLTALAFGLVIVGLAYSVGNVSGCHVNPAVSFAMLIERKLSVMDFFGYCAAQIAGATVGAFALIPLVGIESGLGTNALYDGNVWLSFLIEALLTFMFVFVILGVTSKVANGAISGLVIGLTLTLVHLFGIHFTGTSVNPARSLGPALLVQGDALKNVWVFILAPLCGAAVAAFAHRMLETEQHLLKKAERQNAK